jgi:hypothetical protein
LHDCLLIRDVQLLEANGPARPSKGIATLIEAPLVTIDHDGVPTLLESSLDHGEPDSGCATRNENRFLACHLVPRWCE